MVYLFSRRRKDNECTASFFFYCIQNILVCGKSSPISTSLYVGKNWDEPSCIRIWCVLCACGYVITILQQWILISECMCACILHQNGCVCMYVCICMYVCMYVLPTLSHPSQSPIIGEDRGCTRDPWPPGRKPQSPPQSAV